MTRHYKYIGPTIFYDEPPMHKVQMPLAGVLGFVKLSIQRGLYTNAIDLLDDVIRQVETDPNKEVLRPSVVDSIGRPVTGDGRPNYTPRPGDAGYTEGVDLHPVPGYAGDPP